MLGEGVGEGDASGVGVPDAEPAAVAGGADDCVDAAAEAEGLDGSGTD